MLSGFQLPNRPPAKAKNRGRKKKSSRTMQGKFRCLHLRAKWIFAGNARGTTFAASTQPDRCSCCTCVSCSDGGEGNPAPSRNWSPNPNQNQIEGAQFSFVCSLRIFPYNFPVLHLTHKHWQSRGNVVGGKVVGGGGKEGNAMSPLKLG